MFLLSSILCSVRIEIVVSYSFLLCQIWFFNYLVFFWPPYLWPSLSNSGVIFFCNYASYCLKNLWIFYLIIYAFQSIWYNRLHPSQLLAIANIYKCICSVLADWHKFVSYVNDSILIGSMYLFAASWPDARDLYSLVREVMKKKIINALFAESIANTWTFSPLLFWFWDFAIWTLSSITYQKSLSISCTTVDNKLNSQTRLYFD